ncbi:hypothetical protein [Aquisalinus flavus]|uniref:Uncharacterized protein n=1 Tax=Aquisalinus flavus TaxID=1526572 RepID=A0A8J2V6I0_9PROT|nr:hypothetical protein [Aquisalinus flavus]GGD05109.1 hypothetical protein GCM10011342_12530 [Aquisalinus flavus]
MFNEHHDKIGSDDYPKEPSLDLVGLVFIGVLVAIPLGLYLIAAF